MQWKNYGEDLKDATDVRNQAQCSFDRAEARFNAKSDVVETLVLKEPPDPILLAKFEETLKESRQSRDDAKQSRDKVKQALEDEKK